MKRYHITVLDLKDYKIECDGMNYSTAGCYEFWKYSDTGSELKGRVIYIAYFPIYRTIITEIEEI